MQYAHMSHGLPQAEQPAYSPHVEFNAPNPRKRTHSVAEGPQQYMQGQDQLQEYPRGSTHIPNMTYPSASNAVMQTSVYDLPGQTGGAISGLNQGDLEGLVASCLLVSRGADKNPDILVGSTQPFPYSQNRIMNCSLSLNALHPAFAKHFRRLCH